MSGRTSAIRPRIARRGASWRLDEAAGTLDLRRGPKTDGPHPTSLVPFDYVDSAPLSEALPPDR